MKTKSVRVEEIRIDGGTQQRVSIEHHVVQEYSEAMKCGAKFPPVVTFFDGVHHWLADGFHRYHASRDAEFQDMLAEVHEGTKREAILYSAGANATHGIRVTNADKRKSVLTLLQDKEWCGWSDREIAKHCHVTHPFVAKMREEINPKPLKVKEKKEQVVTVTTPPKPSGKDEDYDPEQDRVAELTTTVTTLAEENESLKDVIAAGVMPGTEEDRKTALDTMQSLRAEVKTLTASLKAVTKSRDQLMSENSQLKKQCAGYLAKIKKLEKK